MNFNQGKLVDGLIDDMMQTIHKYDDTLYMATVIGALEFVKFPRDYKYIEPFPEKYVYGTPLLDAMKGDKNEL